jgi:serine/threonine protein kinase
LADSAGERGMKFTYPSGSRPLKGYTIKRGIGIGGFGEVYFALSDAGKEVALKKILRNRNVEVRGVTQCLNIKHVNLISLWDIRTSAQNESWVVMEYVPGPSLCDILHDYPQGLPEADIKLWMVSIASGVAHLHQRGILHRDLKPGNVFRDDDAHVVKIGDYGLSKLFSSRRSGHTETIGTVHYMAPEIGKGEYGKEIDIYALGIILYELITGDVPFDGESSQEILVKHLTESPNLDVLPPKFRGVIGKALEKSPRDRYHNVSSFAADLPWEDIAQRSAQIATLHSMGSFPLQTGYQSKEQSPAQVFADASVTRNPVNVEGATIRPILITDDDVQVVRPDIVFGPLSEHPAANESDVGEKSRIDRRIRKTTPPRRSDGTLPGEIEAEKPSVIRPRKLAKRTTVIGKDALGLDVNDPDDPIQVVRSSDHLLAKASATSATESPTWLDGVAEKYDLLSYWWSNSNVSTPIKMTLLMLVAALVLAYPNWILPLAFLMGLVFGVDFLMQTWLSDFNPKSPSKTARVLKRKSQIRAAALLRQTDAVREWIDIRPMSDRLTELVGSFFVSALSCIVLSLLAMAMHDSLFSPVVESWAYYTWIAITSVIASWIVLVFAKLWESREGEVWLRRLMMGGVGLTTWVVSVFFANVFSIDLASPISHVERSVSAVATNSPIIEVPVLFGYAIFFVILFVALRWWQQADPVRETRLSIWAVGLSLVWAAVISQLFGLPLIGNCVLATAISVSVQLGAPWLSSNRRELIQSTLTSSSKAIS